MTGGTEQWFDNEEGCSRGYLHENNDQNWGEQNKEQDRGQKVWHDE